MIRLSSPHLVPSQHLNDWGPAVEPLSDPVAQIRGLETIVTPGALDRMGVWECSPGRWRRQVMEREFAWFVSGRARFIPDTGEPLDISPGDAIWFPAYTTGIWDVTETIRKIYLITGFTATEQRHGLLRRYFGHITAILKR